MLKYIQNRNIRKPSKLTILTNEFLYSLSVLKINDDMKSMINKYQHTITNIIKNVIGKNNNTSIVTHQPP